MFNIVGADCNDALDLILLRRDKRTDKWITMFRPAAFGALAKASYLS